MNKRHLHHFWTIVRNLKPQYLLILAAVSGIVCILALRNNNLQMVQLRETLYTADKDSGDTETALRNLRGYVYAHMNTNLASGRNAVRPPIQLKYTYERLTQAQNEKNSNSTSGNSEIYAQAQTYCEKAIPTGFSGSNRLNCIQDYIKQHGIVAATTQTIPKSLYQFDFVSPVWSPDLAGWSLVATILLLLSAIGLWLFQNVIRRLLHR